MGQVFTTANKGKKEILKECSRFKLSFWVFLRSIDTIQQVRTAQDMDSVVLGFDRIGFGWDRIRFLYSIDLLWKLNSGETENQ